MAVKECCCVELSYSKKSIFGLRMGSQIFCLLFVAGFVVAASAQDTEVSCTSVRSIFEKGGLSEVDIQEQPNSDAGELCLRRGCCGASSRTFFMQQARAQLEGALKSELKKLSDILATRALRFNEFFRKLLEQSRNEFHTMFKRTYGMIYEQHSYVFEQLFEELERYYSKGDTDFDKMMDRFFGILYQKMFSVLNSQYTFDEKYLKCVVENMRDIKPFEDVPNKLQVQLRRAIVATRTFHKALRAGSDVLRNMQQVGVTQECVTAWARLRFCGQCSGHTQPACSRYCHNVARGCLPQHADLGEQWDAYVDAVEKVADRLLGPFNIAMVIEPIDIKISEAIMSFQEHNQEISQKIFSGCGKPVLGGSTSAAGPFFAPDRSKRSVVALPDFDWNQKANDVDDFEIEASFESLVNNDPSLANLRTPESIRKATEELAEQAKLREKFLDYMRGKIGLEEYEEHERRRRDAEPEPAAAGPQVDFRLYDFDGKRGSKKKKPYPSEEGRSAEWGASKLEKLVRETRARMKSSRRYWSHLPALLCSPVSVTTSPCFNGTHVASYTTRPAGEGTAALASNTEVRGSAGAGGAGTARAQLDALRATTAKLKDAYNGLEVQWKDEDIPAVRPSSPLSSRLDLDFEGSGSGSGDDINYDDNLPEDDEDKNVFPEGSGQPDTPAFTNPEVPSVAPPASEPPFIPSIVNNPNTNVNIRSRVPDVPTDSNPVQETPVKEKPVPGSAESTTRPSLHKALFTYALPVVCAWFGTIVTDLF